MTTLKDLCNRAIELDAKATPGPWDHDPCGNSEYDTFASKHCAQMAKALPVYEEALKTNSRILDGIKYELEASVYTVEDDEFSSIFYARDVADEALAKAEKIMAGEE